MNFDDADRLIPRPKDIAPMDGDEFRQVLEWAAEIAYGCAPDSVANPSEKQIHMDMGDGSIGTIQFTDIPQNRLVMAVSQHYRSNRPKFYSFMFRVWALMPILQGGLPPEYARQEGNGQAIHDAVFEVAATLPLTKRGEFHRARFLAELRRIAPPDEMRG